MGKELTKRVELAVELIVSKNCRALSYDDLNDLIIDTAEKYDLTPSFIREVSGNRLRPIRPLMTIWNTIQALDGLKGKEKEYNLALKKFEKGYYSMSKLDKSRVDEEISTLELA
jgi:hypothetical protein